MAGTIYTRTLAQAAEVQGSTQALASLLRVPENTLLRWMSGRAQMPLQAFHRLIEMLAEHERKAGSPPQPPSAGAGEKHSFNIGEVFARCPRCGGTQFTLAVPGSTLGMTSMLLCSSCTFSVAHGELLAKLASEQLQHARAMTALKKSPALRRRDKDKVPDEPQASAKIIRLGRR